jgi:hypothetical protein
MKKMKFFIISIMVTVFYACAGNQENKTSTKDSAEVNSTVDQLKETPADEQLAKVGCAKCQLGLKCDSCKLAVKIGEEAYFVEGIDYNVFAEDGLCSMVKNAMVAGKIKNKTFKATKIELIADADIKDK